MEGSQLGLQLFQLLPGFAKFTLRSEALIVIEIFGRPLSARTANVRSWPTFAGRSSAYLVEHQCISLHEADSNVSA